MLKEFCRRQSKKHVIVAGFVMRSDWTSV